MFLIGLMMSNQKTEEQKTRYSGNPMSEEELKELVLSHLKAALLL